MDDPEMQQIDLSTNLLPERVYHMVETLHTPTRMTSDGLLQQKIFKKSPNFSILPALILNCRR